MISFQTYLVLNYSLFRVPSKDEIKGWQQSHRYEKMDEWWADTTFTVEN